MVHLDFALGYFRFVMGRGKLRLLMFDICSNALNSICRTRFRLEG